MYDQPDINEDPFLAPLDDASILEEDLERLLDPWLPQPDHRVLEQTRYLPLPQGGTQDLFEPNAGSPLPYIALLQATVSRYHQMAVAWEQQTTSTATRLLWAALGIRTIAETHPLVWLEATPMMRELREWQQYVGKDAAAPPPPPRRNRYNDPDIDPFAGAG
jgi:hypothetical protein